MGAKQSALFDTFGMEEEFNPYRPFGDEEFEADLPTSEHVTALMNMDVQSRRTAFRRSNYAESTLLTCICLEASQPDNGLAKVTQDIHNRAYTNCFTGYNFVKWLKNQQYVTSKTIGLQIAQKMLFSRLMEHVEKKQCFEVLNKTPMYTFNVGACASKVLRSSPTIQRKVTPKIKPKISRLKHFDSELPTVLNLSQVATGETKQRTPMKGGGPSIRRGHSSSDSARSSGTPARPRTLTSDSITSAMSTGSGGSSVPSLPAHGRGLSIQRRVSRDKNWDVFGPDALLGHKFVCLTTQRKLQENLISQTAYHHIVKMSGVNFGITNPFDAKFFVDNAITPQGLVSPHRRPRVSSDFAITDDVFAVETAPVTVAETRPTAPSPRRVIRRISSRWDDEPLPKLPAVQNFLDRFESKDVLLFLYSLLLRPAELTEEQQTDFLNSLELGNYRAGETIIQQGTPADDAKYWYVVLRGRVSVMKSVEGGTPRHVVKLPEGSFFGESAHLTGKPRSATIKAYSSVPNHLKTAIVCKCLKLRKEKLLQFCKESEKFHQIMLHIKEHVEKVSREREEAESCSRNRASTEVEVEGFSNETGVRVSRTMIKRRNSGAKEICSDTRTYRVDRVIGEGMQGKVKLIIDIADQRQYAMKAMFRKEKGAKIGADPMARIKKQVEMMKTLRHPNVVLLHEVIDDPNNEKLYLVQEYVEGGAAMGEKDLAENCEALPYSLAWTLFRDMLNGLEYLHKHCVVHRDLKPSNILITKDLRGKIADFGVSTALQDQADEVIGSEGSPIFMAPEVIGVGHEGSYSGQAADMYSLGATLYAFLFGRVPFPATNFMALFEIKLKVCLGLDVVEVCRVCLYHAWFLIVSCLCAHISPFNFGPCVPTMTPFPTAFLSRNCRISVHKCRTSLAVLCTPILNNDSHFKVPRFTRGSRGRARAR